jgi:FMN-dependent NADH-azoreductase
VVGRSRLDVARDAFGDQLRERLVARYRRQEPEPEHTLDALASNPVDAPYYELIAAALEASPDQDPDDEALIVVIDTFDEYFQRAPAIERARIPSEDIEAIELNRTLGTARG